MNLTVRENTRPADRETKNPNARSLDPSVLAFSLSWHRHPHIILPCTSGSDCIIYTHSLFHLLLSTSLTTGKVLRRKGVEIPTSEMAEGPHDEKLLATFDKRCEELLLATYAKTYEDSGLTSTHKLTNAPTAEV